MSKIPTADLCMVDQKLYALFDKINPHLHSIGVTPNMITLGSVVSACGSIYAFYKKQYMISGGLFVVAQILDAQDGYYARKYNMVSTTGDWLDHITDVVSGVGLFWVLYHTRDRFSGPVKIMIALWVALLLLVVWLQMSCIEKRYSELNADNSAPPQYSVSLKYLPQTVSDKTCKKYFGSGLRHFNISTVSLLYVFVCLMCSLSDRGMTTTKAKTQ